ncbi:exportin-1, putative [Plasmodium chabaudi chabaudi]|uniref:Exportin-T n=1 Tax=Plasmodium chabaudi chabaudi TaxID=31271 RepID=A0A1C6YRH8_PLACU|nr:exportin-1, putative [Plasmodium chabaudi chabaudi]
MDELEVAILCLYGNESSQINKNEARKYCEMFQNNSDSWKYCITKLIESDKLEIKFFCVNVIIEKLGTLKIEDLIYIKNSLYTYLEKKYITINEDPCVVNKIIQLYLYLIEYLYPNNMADGFKFIINNIMVNNDMNIKNIYIFFFLKLMSMLDTEYIDNSYAKKNLQVVTNLKESIKNNDLPLIVECFYYIMNLNIEENTSLAIFTLAKYVPWIDINYVVNDKVLSFVYNTLNSINPISQASYPFLTSLIKKGMNPVNKIQFIESINIIYIIQNSPKIVDTSFEINKNIMMKKGELINNICLELVESIFEITKLKDYEMNIMKYNEICDKATNLLFLILPHALDIFSANDFYITSTVEPFFSLFFTKFKGIIEFAPGTNTENNNNPNNCNRGIASNSYKIPMSKLNVFINSLMCTTVNKFEFPSYIEENYDEEDEDYITFINFRENIEKLFQRLILFDKLKSIEIIKNAIQYLNENFDNLQWNNIECKLYAFYVTTSIYSEYKGNSSTNSGSNNNTKQQQKDSAEMSLNYNNLLYECLIELLKNRKIVNCNNTLININLMEIFQRLNLFFIKNPQYIEYSLHVFITNGIRSNKNSVVKKAIHIFKKFIKNNSIVISNYIKDILQMLEPYLDIPCPYQKIRNNGLMGSSPFNTVALNPDTIKSIYTYMYNEKNYTYDDQIDIYETAGLLLLYHDFSRGKKLVNDDGYQSNRAASNMCNAGTDLNSINEKMNEQLIPIYKERILFFKGVLNKLLENLASIKNLYINSPKTQQDTLCLSFTCSIIIKCIGALCKNVNISMTDTLINDLDNTLGLIISESLELFYTNYLVRDSVLYTYRILSNLFKELSLNYTIKILPYFYNISYNMIMEKLKKGNSTDNSGTSGNAFSMTTPTSFQMSNNPSENNSKNVSSRYQEELKYLYSELNELSILVCHLISTYKEKSFDTFIKPYIHNITQIHLSVWKRIHVQSIEMQREQNSVLSPLLLIFYNISLNIPTAIHNFISFEHVAINHKHFCDMFANDDLIKTKIADAVTSILLISLNYKNTIDLSICLYSFQTITNILNSAANMPTADEILSKYPLMQIIETICLSLKFLDYSDPKNKRVIQEALTIFRLLCGFKGTTNCLPRKIIESSQMCLQNSLLSAFKNNQNDIHVLLQAINENNQQQFRHILSNFAA